MVRKLSISPEESDLSLPTGEEEKEVREADPLSSNYPTWSSRFKCFEAYICVTMSFTSTMNHCRTIVLYGSTAFLAYILYAFMFGVPIVLVEVLLGRYVMGNVTRAWSMCPLAKGVLVCLFGTTAFTIVTDNVCNAYLFKYIFSLYHGYIPWDACREPWAKNNCFVLGNNATTLTECFLEHSEQYCLNLSWESSGTQYWKYVAGSTTDVLEVCLTASYLALSTIIVVLINLRGHRSCEKVFIVLVYVPIFFSLVLTFVSYNSLGALGGIFVHLRFDWNFVFDVKMWLVVFEDFLVSLTLATLALSFVSSHGKFKDNIFIDVLVVIFTCIFSPSLIAIPILSMIGSMKALYIGSPMSESLFITEDGSKTSIFLWMSEVAVEYPYPNVFWAFIFYLEMLLMCLSTQTIMVLACSEAIGAVFFEKKKFLYNAIIVAVMSFALSIPYLFIRFDFEFPIETFAITIIFLYAVTWQVCYGFKKFNDDYHFMLGYAPSLFSLRIYWICTIPVLLVTLGVKAFYRIPNKPLKDIIYIYMGIPCIVYAFVGAVEAIRSAKKGKFASAFMADPDWGPDNPVLKMSRIMFDTRAVTKEFMYRQELFKKPLMKPPDFSQQNIVQLL